MTSMVQIGPEQLCGVWSATPTPFIAGMQIDRAAVQRLVEHHLRLGVKGLFLCGTCGEGPWMTDGQRRAMIEAVAEFAQGCLVIAAQVTDNSTARILDNMAMAAAAGADIAVIAPPYMFMNATDENLTNLYLESIRNSPLPVGIYDRGAHGPVAIPDAVLPAIYAEPGVLLVKDSSLSETRREIALAARRARGHDALFLLNGYEFGCVEYLEAGYDGLLLGGGIFNGLLARQIIEAVHNGDLATAKALQDRMNELMWAVYGGEKITCWLTGLKELLVRMGIFGTTQGYLNYPLTEACSKAIDEVLEREAGVLLP